MIIWHLKVQKQEGTEMQKSPMQILEGDFYVPIKHILCSLKTKGTTLHNSKAEKPGETESLMRISRVVFFMQSGSIKLNLQGQTCQLTVL